MIIGILAPGGGGGTFLDWTLHWLADDQSYFYIPRGIGANILGHGQLASVVDDPLTGTTAHKHNKTHPNDVTVHQGVSMMQKKHAPGIKTFYYVDTMMPDRTRPNHHELVSRYPDIFFLELSFNPDMAHMIFCNQMEKIPTVQTRWLETAKSRLQPGASISEIREILSLYYPLCVMNQLNLGSTSIAPNHYILPYDQMLNDLPNLLPEIFGFLQIDIKHQRLANWLLIYERWRNTATNRFFNDLTEIVQNIVQNRYQSLGQYNMTVGKEIVLANRLLFVHNLSLKLSNLETMPLDTNGWHRLLETNVYHDLSNSRIEQSATGAPLL